MDSIQHNQPDRPDIEYIFPGDEEKIKTDALALGYLAAISMPSLQGGGIEKEARRRCRLLKRFTSAQSLTTNFKTLQSLFTPHFVAMYNTRQAHYKAHPDKLAADNQALADMGGGKSFILARADIEKNVVVRIVEVQ